MLNQELSELAGGAKKGERDPRRLSPEQRETYIKGVLYQAALNGETEYSFGLNEGIDCWVKKDDGKGKEFSTTGPDEKEVKNAFGQNIILTGYGKQLHDFLESQGLHLIHSRGGGDGEKGFETWDVLHVSWGNDSNRD